VQRNGGRTGGGRLNAAEVEPPTAETVVVEQFRENTFKLENERANNPGPAVAESALAETRRLGVFEAEGVSPVYCGPNAREQALSYARQRAGYGRTEVQVFDEADNFAETLGYQEARPLV
jgi:hypothetical protein